MSTWSGKSRRNALLLTVLGSASLAQAAAPVTIGAEDIGAEKLEHALLACRTSAPSIDPAACIDRYWVPLWLMDRSARARKLDETAGYLQRRTRILAQALVEDVEQATPAPSAQRIQGYLEDNARAFERPKRIRVFRILLATQEEAQALLKRLAEDPTPQRFRELARQHSTDRATHERGGDLGYLWPDGSTDVPQVRSVPSLYEAAAEVEPGQLVPTPVKEGDFFAVVQNRGVLPASSVPADEQRRLALPALREQAAAEGAEKLLGKLRQQHLHELHPDMLNRFKREENRLFER